MSAPVRTQQAALAAILVTLATQSMIGSAEAQAREEGSPAVDPECETQEDD
jgi:hypothetical protein